MVPGTTVGATTMPATRLSGLPSSSSHVTTSAVRPVAYAGLARIDGTHDCSHASPVDTGQSWVSLQRSGVMKENAGNVSFARSSWNAPADGVPIGTSQAAQSVRMPVKYAAGLCLTAYVPEVDSAQFDGIASWYDRHCLPASVTWLKTDGLAIGCAAGLASSVTPNVEPPVPAR